MGQNGYAKIVAVLVLSVIIASGTYVGYRSAHASAPLVKAQKASAVAQVVKVDEAKLLQTKLETAWKQTLASAPPDGNVDIAVYDSRTGATAHFVNQPSTFMAASTIKLSILETLLLHDQQQGLSGLTSDQLAEADSMIEDSDNDSANSLYLVAGGSSGLNDFFRQAGATNSVASGPWGITQTTALDQLKVIGAVAYPGKLLTEASAKQANDLMDQVESDQRWGVTGGVPTGVAVELKNGWLQDSEVDGTDGWNVNSIGHVHGKDADYTIAVLTNNNNTMQAGINTIEKLSADTWNVASTAAAN